MLHLATLGGLILESDGGPLAGAALRPRPLALLALVACAGLRGITRDKVMAYLWPDSDVGHARNCLKQTLFALRHDLHCDPFLHSAAMLWLDPQTIGVDCRAFLQAVEQRAFRTAVELYRGPFLDGFHLGRHAEFEPWLRDDGVRTYARFLVTHPWDTLTSPLESFVSDRPPFSDTEAPPESAILLSSSTARSQ